MNTPLSFTVTVTGCKNCPYSHIDGFGLCDLDSTLDMDASSDLFRQNKDQLTNSCPMVAKEEGEKK